MRYYNLDFGVYDNRAKASIGFAVPEKKIKNYNGKELINLQGSLKYSSINPDYKNATLNEISFDSLSISSQALSELYEFKNQVQYLEKKLADKEKVIKNLKDVLNYLTKSDKFKRVIYDPREQEHIEVEKVKPEEYHRFNAYTDNDSFVMSIVSDKKFKEVENKLKEKAKNKLNSKNIDRRMEKMLTNFIENGYVQRDHHAKKPEIKNMW